MEILTNNPNTEVIRYNDFDQDGTKVICNSFRLKIGLNKYTITDDNGNLKVIPQYAEKIMIDCNKSCSYIDPVSSIKFGIRKGQ